MRRDIADLRREIDDLKAADESESRNVGGPAPIDLTQADYEFLDELFDPSGSLDFADLDGSADTDTERA